MTRKYEFISILSAIYRHYINIQNINKLFNFLNKI